MQTGIAFPSFTCLGDTPPFENKNERTTYLCIPYRRFYFLEPRFPLFLRKALSRGALGLTAKIHLFRRRGSGAQGSRLAQGDAWQKCDFAALYYTLLCKYCEEVSRTDGKVTSRHDRGWSAPRSRHASARPKARFSVAEYYTLLWKHCEEISRKNE